VIPPFKNHINTIINLLESNGFKFESEGEEQAYQSGFGKPDMFDNKILAVPYYDIIQEQITEDVTSKEKPREVKRKTRRIPAQKVRYIIDTNIFANEGFIFVCRIDSLDNAKRLLIEYLKTLPIVKKLNLIGSVTRLLE
jgi:hypothetical protein